MRRTAQVNITLTQDEKDLLKKLAEKMNGSQSQIMRLALSRYTQQLALENANTN